MVRVASKFLTFSFGFIVTSFAAVVVSTYA